MSNRFVDLSHEIENGMITYQGLPPPIISEFLSREASRDHYAPGTEFHIGRIDIVANTGTYIDSPFHRFAEGQDLSQWPLTSLADLPGMVIRAEFAGGRQAITLEDVSGDELKGKAVLIHTGWDAHWNSPAYFSGHPHLTAGAADLLVRSGAALVGIDSLNIDGTENAQRPVHSTLLAAGIPIVEHLCRLETLPDSGFRFFAVPPKIKGLGSFPVRAFALTS